MPGPAIRLLRRDERAATSIEYALIGTIVSIVIMAALAVIGEDIEGMLMMVADGFGGPD